MKRRKVVGLEPGIAAAIGRATGKRRYLQRGRIASNKAKSDRSKECIAELQKIADSLPRKNYRWKRLKVDDVADEVRNRTKNGTWLHGPVKWKYIYKNIK